MRRKFGFSAGLILWAVFVCGLLSSGCGYSVHRHSNLPFADIQIRMIENKTREPKLQDKLHAALTEEFMKNGIMVTPSSDTKLSAVVHTFDMTILSERKEITIEYMVTIRADFIVEDREGKKRSLKNIDSPFIVSFASSEDIATLLAKKELLEERAMRDVAMKIAGALIYE